MINELKILLSLDESVNNDFLTVLRTITTHFHQLVSQPPALGSKPLKVIYWKNFPICIINYLPVHYTIGLTVHSRDYQYLIFQFAHELTHVYCDPRITNWFIESICDMTSLYYLDFFSTFWSVAPPPQKDRHYFYEAIKLKTNNYVQFRNQLSLTGDDFSQEHFTQMLLKPKKAYDRAENHIIAYRLLDFFRENKQAWRLLPLLGLATDKELTDGCLHQDSIPDFDKLVNLAGTEQKDVAIKLRELMQIIPSPKDSNAMPS